MCLCKMYSQFKRAFGCVEQLLKFWHNSVNQQEWCEFELYGFYIIFTEKIKTLVLLGDNNKYIFKNLYVGPAISQALC